jgi:hypothetical protein
MALSNSKVGTPRRSQKGKKGQLEKLRVVVRIRPQLREDEDVIFVAEHSAKVCRLLVVCFNDCCV